MKRAMKPTLTLLVLLTTSLISAQTAETSPNSASQDSQSQTSPAQNPAPPSQAPETPPAQPPSQTAPQENPGSQTAPPPAAQPQTPPPAAAPAEPYKPKFPGDPARSESEAQALGYMRVVLRAEQLYKKRHNKYATSLSELAGTGSFTRRMAKTTERGDYSVGFRPHKDGFILVMTPKQMDNEHRSFYAEEDAVIHADDQKAADANSPRIK